MTLPSQRAIEPDEIEREARRLHTKRCNFYGIVDPTQIDSYWETCDQSMYRTKAADLASTQPEHGGGR